MKKFKVIVLSLVVLVGLSSNVPKKPKILIIGDSISIGYFPEVKKALSQKAIVAHNPGNAQHTGTGLERITEWIGDGDWDIVQFNWGLWDLCYRHPDSKLYGHRDKINGTLTYTVEEYSHNLKAIIEKIKTATHAKLVFVTTTAVPGNEGGRYPEDVVKYNQAALKIMKEESVAVNDLYKKSIAIHKKYGKGDDDVHYTEEGYKKLSELIVPFLIKELH